MFGKDIKIDTHKTNNLYVYIINHILWIMRKTADRNTDARSDFIWFHLVFPKKEILLTLGLINLILIIKYKKIMIFYILEYFQK